MNSRISWAIIISLMGVALFLKGFFDGSFYFLGYAGIAFFILGMIILFNKKEDLVEQIKKGGKK